MSGSKLVDFVLILLAVRVSNQMGGINMETKIATFDKALACMKVADEQVEILGEIELRLPNGQTIPVTIMSTPKWQEDFIRAHQTAPSIDGAILKGLKLRKLERTCFACPSQWDAETEDGRILYIRYRYGCLRVDMGGCGGETVYCQHVGDDMDGFMDDEEMLELTGMVLTEEARI
jgi:hypothetical protein